MSRTQEAPSAQLPARGRASLSGPVIEQAGPHSSRLRRSRERGQALVEFALLVPLMLLLAVALGDFGRLFTAAMAVESAAREAADYGAMQGNASWAPSNYTLDPATYAPMELDMRMRACTAASSLSDYVGDPPGTPGMDCTNPSFVYSIERMPVSGDCSMQGEFDPPCIIHVTLTYDFHMFLNFPPMPSVFHMTRGSQFAISDLQP